MLVKSSASFFDGLKPEPEQTQEQSNTFAFAFMNRIFPFVTMMCTHHFVTHHLTQCVRLFHIGLHW